MFVFFRWWGWRWCREIEFIGIGIVIIWFGNRNTGRRRCRRLGLRRGRSNC